MAEGFANLESTILSPDSIECAICTEILADPRVLPCGHSFCGPPRECLKAVRRDGSIRCAVCKTDFEQSVDSLKPLFGIRDYLKASALQQKCQKSSLHLSDFSTCDDHPEKIVYFWCCQCQKKICLVCFGNNHEQHPLTPYRKYLQTQLKKHLRVENLFSKEVLQLSDDVAQQCDDKILALEVKILRYRRFKFGLLYKGNEYRRYLIEDCEKFSPFAEDINVHVNLKHLEMVLKQQSQGKNLEMLAKEALESLEEDKKLEFITTFHGYSVGGKFRSWEGGIDFIQDSNQFKIRVLEPEYAAVPVDSTKTPLVASISWIYVGESQDVPHLGCFSFEGFIVVRKPDEKGSKKIHFKACNDTISSPNMAIVEIELPLIFCEPLALRKALTTAKQRLSINLGPKDLTRHTFTLRCVISFKLPAKKPTQTENTVVV